MNISEQQLTEAVEKSIQAILERETRFISIVNWMVVEHLQKELAAEIFKQLGDSHE